MNKYTAPPSGSHAPSRFSGRPAAEILDALKGQIALQMSAAAKLRVQTGDSEELAGRYRQLAAELDAITNTPLPQATRYVAELRAELDRPPAEGDFMAARLAPQLKAELGAIETALAEYASAHKLQALQDTLTGHLEQRTAAAELVKTALGRIAAGAIGAARQSLDEALERDVSLALAWRVRGRLRAEAKEHLAAIPDYARALQLAPDCCPALIDRAASYRYIRDYPNAVADLDTALKLCPRSAPALVHRGFIRSQQGKFDSSLADLNAAIEIDPANYAAYSNRGNTLAKLGRQDRALDDYNRALELHPRYFPAYNNRGNLYREIKEYQRALADFDAALAIEPDTDYVLNNRGNIYSDLKQYDKALADYTRSIELDPDSPETYNNRAVVYIELGRKDEALADLGRTLERDPRNSRAYSTRAFLFSETGRVEDAIRDYNTSLGIDPNDSIDHLNLAEMYLTSNRYQDLLDTLHRSDPHLTEDGDRLLLYYLKALAELLLGMDTKESDLHFDKIFPRVSYVGWSFKEIDGWLQKTELTPLQIAGIIDRTEKLKQKTQL